MPAKRSLKQTTLLGFVTSKKPRLSRSEQTHVSSSSDDPKKQVTEGRDEITSGTQKGGEESEDPKKTNVTSRSSLSPSATAQPQAAPSASASSSASSSAPTSTSTSTATSSVLAPPPPSSPTNSPNPQPSLSPTKPPSPTKAFTRIVPHTGSLFPTAPPNTLLIHACNTLGSWGGGIAAQFARLYPSAYKVYKSHCVRHKHNRGELVGRALLIPPLDSPSLPGLKEDGKGDGTGPGVRGHYIGCLFTSLAYGKKRDSEDKILAATAKAWRWLMRLVCEAEEGGEMIREVRMCKINAGLFGVPWESTKRAIEGVELREGEVPNVGRVEGEEGCRVEVQVWEIGC
ncbi:putative ADP-ribose 1''-phosphate protein [Thermochaetoides thermophila DSM 1495]|uniref:ADP-ribose 1''-phosphate phosphatase n=1 Tax=Chaetomium thermophilum (strain DSM 1495 / CBS 144.50 / IMI 039719) TaxID=759272 RepID=G0RYI2_CHATD|nr:putative ADP-ribose 1''-phosphate protein [Thermochaetoides thermophila DSM 1495]EGS23968.1 putative ADP-ribose 1''-phosphate protein [Thermochaetoides thermophila DSM 1495]